MTAVQPQKDSTQVYHEGSLVWVPVYEVVNSLTADTNKKNSTHWRRGRVEVRLDLSSLDIYVL